MKEEYEPFGDEWREEISQFKKAELIELYRSLAIRKLEFEHKYLEAEKALSQQREDTIRECVSRIDAEIKGKESFYRDSPIERETVTADYKFIKSILQSKLEKK